MSSAGHLVGAMLALGMVLGGAGALSSCCRPSRPIAYTERATEVMMGTEVSATAVALTPEAARRAVAAALAEVNRLEGLLSHRIPASDVGRCNALAARGPVNVAPETFELMQSAAETWHLTNGAFDPTVLPLVRLWQECARARRLPTAAELAVVQASVGCQHVVLDVEHRAIRFAREGVALDLGGIAKGYAADRAAIVMRASGATGGLIACAGDIVAFGCRADGRPWRVGVQDPRHPESTAALVDTLEFSDMAVSTSGNYRRFSEIGGKPYSHILDPRTGWPADAVPSVTVIAPNGRTADALATGISVLGLEEGLRLVESLPNVEALLLTIEEGRIVRHESTGYWRYRSPQSD